MPTLQTWGGKSIFSYTGSIQNGTMITYGQNRTARVTENQYNALLNHFEGQTIEAGTSRTNRHRGILLKVIAEFLNKKGFPSPQDVISSSDSWRLYHVEMVFFRLGERNWEISS